VAEPSNEYAERTPAGDWRLTGTRVSLASVVHGYWDGQPAEGIAADFPAATAEQVYGAIAFYLRHRAEIDAHLRATAAAWDRFRADSAAAKGPLLARLRAARVPA
jgi:uncharacterized protein (DUF433 family)